MQNFKVYYYVKQEIDLLGGELDQKPLSHHLSVKQFICKNFIFWVIVSISYYTLYFLLQQTIAIYGNLYINEIFLQLSPILFL